MIYEDIFQKFDWEDFYPDACEPITLDTKRPRGKSVLTHCFVDVNHAGENITRRSMTGILILCNRYPIIWHSNRQNGVETSTFGSAFTVMNNSAELIGEVRYKLRMFGVPIDISNKILYDNEAVYKNASTPKSKLRKKHHSTSHQMIKEAVASGAYRMAKEDTEINLSYLFTKVITRPMRELLLYSFTY